MIYVIINVIDGYIENDRNDIIELAHIIGSIWVINSLFNRYIYISIYLYLYIYVCICFEELFNNGKIFLKLLI